MNFDVYQKSARMTAIYPDVGNNLWYPALGLAGESGEVAEKIKKLYRDAGGEMTHELRVNLCKELGDVLWYVANIACEAGLHMEDIAIANIRKLADRALRGTLHGSGDDR